MVLRVYLTGNPGIGKTTTFIFLLNELKRRNLKISGFYCPEVKHEGRRIGFKIVDIWSGKFDWLARVDYPGKIKIGRYTVLEDNVNRILVDIASSTSNSDIIAIDEIGPMELSIKSMKDFILKVINSDEKPLLAVVHRSLRDSVKGGKLYTITFDNRDTIKYEILNYILISFKKI